MTNRQLRFTPKDYGRLREVCRALGTSMAEFIEFATIQAITEMEGFAADARAIDAYYKGSNRGSH